VMAAVSESLKGRDFPRVPDNPLSAALSELPAVQPRTTPDVEQSTALVLHSVLEQHEQTQMRARMGPGPKSRTGIEREARHSGRDG